MQDKELEQQFVMAVGILEQLQNRVISLEQENQVLVVSNRELINWVKMVEEDLYMLQNNMQYEVWDKRDAIELWYPTIESEEKTLELIINQKKSLSRFGDGEFAAIQGKVRHKFQTEQDEALGKRLLEVLQSEKEELLVGIADNYGSLQRYQVNIQREIRHYMTPEVRMFHKSILRKDKVYYNAYISRPYVIYKDNHTKAPAKRFEKLKQIWSGRDCVIVEGEQTRMGVGNDLLAGARSVVRILAPAENAFRKYKDILEECRKMPKHSLFLIALGPTASVLAYDLCMEGYWALDIGHLDLEYEWFLRGEGRRTAVCGKYNNEYDGGEKVQLLADPRYEQEIVAKILN